MERQNKPEAILSPLQPTDFKVDTQILKPVQDNFMRVITEQTKADSVIVITVAMRKGGAEIDIAQANCNDVMLSNIIEHLQKLFNPKKL